ncbi:MAG: glycerophosphodiester phosphodiesterase [Phaeodactylibacter sp.]|nr:glycerophosphodiester phosphodiesterase [Phaeodactylibacter sp.]
MKKHHLLALALPLLAVAACTNSSTMSENIDWQGHRGARGLLPENTVPAFLKALEFPEVRTLELDVVLSKDHQLIVSHEPWMSHHICSHSNTMPVRESQEDFLNIYQMTYQQILTFDCGSRGHERFPEQVPQIAHKPSFPEVVEAVNAYCAENNRPLPHYNIEIKAEADWDNKFTPPPAEYVTAVLACLDSLELNGRLNIQSFDTRILEEVRQRAPEIPLAYLVDSVGSVAGSLEALSFKPEIYSPNFAMVNRNVVETVHQLNMRLIPWTVNEIAAMQTLIEIGVDGIITDYPNRIQAALNQ